MALTRTGLRTESGFERRPPAPSHPAQQPVSVTVPPPAHNLQGRIGNLATQALISRSAVSPSPETAKTTSTVHEDAHPGVRLTRSSASHPPAPAQAAHAARRTADPGRISSRNADALVDSLTKAPSDALAGAVMAAHAAAGGIHQQEKNDLHASLSGIAAPVGLQPVVHRLDVPPTYLGAANAPEMPATEGRVAAPYDSTTDSAAGPLPGGNASDAASEPNDEGGGWWDWLVSRVSSFFAQLPTTDSGVNTSAGPRPTVDTTGDGDPARILHHQAASDSVVMARHAAADALTTQNFGEHHISPTRHPGTLKAYKPAPPPKRGGSGAPHAPGHSLAAYNPNLEFELQSRLQEENARYKAERTAFNKEAEQTRDEGERQIAEQRNQARAEQEALRQEAVNHVTGRRQEWREENAKVLSDYSLQARVKHSQTEADVTAKVRDSERQADTELSRAEAQAEFERQAAENRAAEEKKKAEEKPQSWWQSVKGAISSVFSAIKRAITTIFDGLRKIVHKIISAAKAVVHAIIEAARAVIVRLIKAFGEFLKGIVTLALAAFPTLAARARAWIDSKVNAAVDAVNRAAAALEKAADRILDWVGRTIDAALALAERALLALLDLVEAIVSGLARILEILFSVKAAVEFVTGLYEKGAQIVQKTRAWFGEMVEKIPPKAETLIQDEIDKHSQPSAKIAPAKSVATAALTTAAFAPATTSRTSANGGSKLWMHLKGIWNAFKAGVTQLKETWWDHVKTLLWDLLPPVALYHGLKAMWEDGKEAFKLLFSGHFSKAINYALKVVQDLLGMIGSFLLTASILLAIVGFIAGAVLGEGVGAVPGLAAAISVVEIVGLALLEAMLLVEAAVVLKAVYDLAEGAEEDYPDAYARIASSGISVALMIILIVVAWVATKLANLLGRALREALRRLGVDVPKSGEAKVPEAVELRKGRPRPERPIDAPRTPTGEIDFSAWSKRLQAKGIKGRVDDVIARAQAGDNASIAELGTAERYLDAGYEVEFVAPETGPGAAQGVKFADLRVNRPGEKSVRVEVKSREPGQQISRTNLNQVIDKANDQIKGSTEARGDIIVDQTRAAPGGAGQAEIESFLRGKMTDNRLRNIDYLEVVYEEGGQAKRTFMVRSIDGKVDGPFTEKLK
jgi:hypothetical protein